MIHRRNLIKGSLASAALGGGLNLVSAQDSKTRKYTIDLSPGAIGVGAKGDELLDLAVTNGFESVQPNGGMLAGMSDGERKEFAAKVKEKGLKWGAASLPVDFRKDVEKFRSGIKELPEVAAALQGAGVTRVGTWLMPKHNTLTYLENFHQHADRLRDIANILADHGLRFGLEYVGTRSLWSSGNFPFVHTMAETKELIAEIDVPVMGFVLDSWHWYNADETADDILGLENSDIVACDLNDAPSGIEKKDLADTSRELPAATGVIDTAPFLKALVEVGYDGPVRAEPFNKPLREMDDAPAAKATAEAIKKAFAQAGV